MVTISLTRMGDFRVRTDCPHLAKLLQALYPDYREVCVGDASVNILLHDSTGPSAPEPISDVREVVIQRDPVVQRFHRTGRQCAARRRVVTWVAGSGTLIEAAQGGPVVVRGRCAGDQDSVIAAYESNDAFRVVRHALYDHLLARGFIWAHAASLALDNAVYLLLGDSRAGKTTSLINLLRSDGASFLSNGRTLLIPDEFLAAAAFPEVVMLRQAVIRDCPELARELGTGSEAWGGWDAPEHTKTPMLAADFARALHVPTMTFGRVRAVILPCLGRGVTDAPPLILDEEFDDIVARNVAERTYEAREEYSWIFGSSEASSVYSEMSKVLAALRRLPRHVAYLDRSGRLIVHPQIP